MKYLIIVFLYLPLILGNEDFDIGNFCNRCQNICEKEKKEPIPQKYSDVNFCNDWTQNSTFQNLSDKETARNSSEQRLLFPHLTQTTINYLLKYPRIDYEISYSFFSSAIRKSQFSDEKYIKVDLNKFLMFENKNSSDHVYIGFGTEDEGLTLSQVVEVPKEDIKSKEGWDLDFKVNTKQAFCFFCGNGIMEAQECRFSLELATWGGRTKIESNSYIKDGMGDYSATEIFLKGGYFYQTFSFDIFFYLLYFLIPIISSCITIFYHLGRMNYPGTPIISLIGFYVSTTVIYSFIIFVNTHSLFGMSQFTANEFTGLLQFIIPFGCSLYYAVCHWFFFPLFLNGERIGNSYFDVNSDCIYFPAHAFFWVIWYLFVIIFIGNWFFNGVYLSPTSYFWLNNIYVLNIVTNIIGRKAICNFSPSMLLNSVFIGLYPFTNFGPTFWIDGFNFSWFIKFMVIQCILLAILHLQYYYGSLFFLPSYLRRRKYEKFVKVLSQSPETKGNDQCDFCTNCLSEPELEYSDLKLNYKKFNENEFIITPCSHKFHPMCILEQIKKNLKCPVCNKKLPKNDFDD